MKSKIVTSYLNSISLFDGGKTVIEMARFYTTDCGSKVAWEMARAAQSVLEGHRKPVAKRRAKKRAKS